MKIALTEFVTLDGVSQGPGSPTEDTSNGFSRGGWLVPYWDELFVRRTSEAFARDWPQITDPGDPFTERMNSLPKCVVSNTLTKGSWRPTTVLVVAPSVVGSGQRLLDHPGSPVGLRLVHHEMTVNGLLLLQYENAGAAPVGAYAGVTDLV